MDRVGDLEIDQDLAFERRMLRVERAGQAGLAAVVVLALAGAFGGGLFRARAGAEGDSLRLEYDRFVRQNGRQEFCAHLGPGAARDGEARLWLSEGYLEAVELAHVEPPPLRVELGGGGQTFVFAAPGPGPAVVRFHFVPGRPGPLRGRVALEGRGPLAVWQFVYP